MDFRLDQLFRLLDNNFRYRSKHHNESHIWNDWFRQFWRYIIKYFVNIYLTLGLSMPIPKAIVATITLISSFMNCSWVSLLFPTLNPAWYAAASILLSEMKIVWNQKVLYIILPLCVCDNCHKYISKYRRSLQSFSWWDNKWLRNRLLYWRFCFRSSSLWIYLRIYQWIFFSLCNRGSVYQIRCTEFAVNWKWLKFSIKKYR